MYALTMSKTHNVSVLSKREKKNIKQNNEWAAIYIINVFRDTTNSDLFSACTAEYTQMKKEYPPLCGIDMVIHL